MTKVQIFEQPDVVIAAESDVGEGPVWDRRTGRLCWVDITSGVLSEADVTTGEYSSTTIPTTLGAAVPRAAESGFAVAVADGFGVLVEGHLDLIDRALPESFRRMNDAKCDSSGRLWAGSTHFEFVPGVGSLHRWSGDAPSIVMGSGFTLPNGLGWNLDDSIMYLVDSMTHQIFSSSFDCDDGRIGTLTELVKVDGAGLPDGLAVDVDGCLWVAIWGAAEVRRYNSAGKLVGRVPMPVDQPSSCAFGDDGTLYITSARAGLDADRLRTTPHAGSVFAVSTTTRGVPIYDFRA